MPQPTPNLHHLELFYHVAKAGGITAAARVMPYGIQQPAISGQISQLEQELGVRLFQRRPFKLTPAGDELFGYLAPFFNGLPDVAARLAGTASKHLRLAAPATILREHLPAVLAGLRRREPELELTLVETDQREAFGLLEREEIDLAIAELEGRPPAGARCEVLLKMPLVLLLPPGMKVPKDGLKALAGKEALIRPAEDTAMARLFRKGLVRKNLDWPARIEVSALETVQSYAAGGFGIGLTVRAPGVTYPKGTTVMELPGFPELSIAALWRGKAHPFASVVIEGLRNRARDVIKNRD